MKRQNDSDFQSPSMEEFNPTPQNEAPIPIEGSRIDEYEQKRTFVFKGPLSEAMTQALQVAYNKEDPIESEPSDNESENVAMESAAQDQQLLQQLLDRVAPEDAQDADNVTVVYGFPNNSVTSGDVTEITEMFQASADAGENVGDEFAIVIDGTDIKDGELVNDEPKVVNLSAALESIANSYGVKVYRSLADVMRNYTK